MLHASARGGVDLTEEERTVDGIKRNIEAQLAEYEQAIDEAVAWHQNWKARQPKGFRAARRKPQPANEGVEF